MDDLRRRERAHRADCVWRRANDGRRSLAPRPPAARNRSNAARADKQIMARRSQYRPVAATARYESSAARARQL